MDNQLTWQREGFPTQPGWYVVQEAYRFAPYCLWWSAHSKDWRNGALKVDIRGFYGPLPIPARPKRPEKDCLE